MAKKKLGIDGLLPSTDYFIQVRAVDAFDESQWSQKYKVRTVDDTLGGSRKPETPILLSWSADTGSFVAEWTTVQSHDDGSDLKAGFYELSMVTDIGTKVIWHGPESSPTAVREFPVQVMESFFGALPTQVTLTVRVKNTAESWSDWSNALTAFVGVPNPPTDAVTKSIIDGFTVSWTPPADPIHLTGYRVYVGPTEDFEPDYTNLIYQGAAPTTTYSTSTYAVHYLAIRSYSVWGTESSPDLLAEATPKSPFLPDNTPPTKPVLGDIEMNATRTAISVKWTTDDENEDNEDLTGWALYYRVVGDNFWSSAYFAKDSRQGNVPVQRKYANYEFMLMGYDNVSNYSEPSDIKTLVAAPPPPQQITGVDAIAGLTSLEVIWNASESQSVVEEGMYHIQFNTTGTWPGDDNVYTHSSSTNRLVINGLQIDTNYHFRVRAVDSIGQKSVWSDAVQKATNPLPTSPDDTPVTPATAPANVKANGGVGFINLSWDRVPHPRGLQYQVHVGIASGFVPSAANKIADANGTSITLNTMPNGTRFSSSTQYYFKVVPVDATLTGPASAEVSASVTDMASDLGINMSGENLYYNSSFESDSNGDGLANYWTVVNDSPQTEPHETTQVVGRNDYGKAQRISWVGTNTTLKGIMGGGEGILRPNTQYVLSFYARAGVGNVGETAGTGFKIVYEADGTPVSESWMENPTPDPEDWNRYVWKVTTGPAVEIENWRVCIDGHTANGGWIEFDDIQIEAGNIVSAYKEGTVSIAKLATGTLESAVITMGLGGIIKSRLYDSSGGAEGFSITDQLISIRDGEIDAKTLKSDTSIVNDLYINAKLEVATNGFIQSGDYNPTTGVGYRITNGLIDIRSGIIAADAIIGGTISSGGITLGTGPNGDGTITIDQNGSIRSNNFNGDGEPGTNQGWRISSAGIEMWDSESKINVGALVTGTIDTTTITLGNNGVIKSLGWTYNQSLVKWEPEPIPGENPLEPYPRFKLDGLGLDILNGTITGSAIFTNQIQSLTNETRGGISRPKFSITENGYASMSGGEFWGTVIVGGHPEHRIQSSNYWTGSAGWAIRGDGFAEFRNVKTVNAEITGSTVVSNAGVNHIQSSGYTTGYGWRIAGNGEANFAILNVADAANGYIRIQADFAEGIPRNMIKFYHPGQGPGHPNYHNISGRNEDFHIRGGWGGAVVIKSHKDADDPSAFVSIAPHAGVSGDLAVGGQMTSAFVKVLNWADIPGVTVGLINGDPQFQWVGTNSLNSHYAVFGTGGRISRGSQNSSRNYKNNIEALTIDPEKVLALEPKTFFYNEDKQDFWGTNQYAGFIAEEASDLGLDFWVSYDDDEGAPTGFSYPQFTVAQQTVLRYHQDKIKSLEDRLAVLEQGLDK